MHTSNIRNHCMEECRYKKIMESCFCQPPYLPRWRSLKPCTFADHAQCISRRFMDFNFSIECETCPLECVKEVLIRVFRSIDWPFVKAVKHGFTRNVEYGKYHEPIYRTLAKYQRSTGSVGIDIAAFQVRYQLLNSCSSAF